MSEATFADLGVSSTVTRALKERGFDAPFAIQTKVIGDVLKGRDVLAKSPTGSGKTLAFMVPTIDSIDAEAARPAALVLAPTRELATQIVEETRAVAHEKALKVTAVYGGVGIEKQSRDAKKSHIIVATPGRLEDLIQRRAFDLKNVQILVLDEADRMLDMGFIPAVERIVEQCPKDRQTLFFSATLDGMAGKIAKQFTNDPAHHEHRAPQEKKANIEHQFVLVNHDSKLKRLVAELGDQWDLNLVFVRTKRGADRLVKRLNDSGVKANAMHGDKTQRQREKALADFEAGRVTTLVATDVAARGIHVDSIAKVINFDIPAQSEDYVHRVGRTGRAGERGVAVTFVCGDQMREMKGMTRELRLENQFADAGENGRTAPVHVEREPGERPVRKERSTTGDRPRQHAGESNGERSRGGGKKRRHRNPKSGVGKGSGKPSGKSKSHRKGQSRNANPNANGEGGHSAGPRNGGGNGPKSGSRNGNGGGHKSGSRNGNGNGGSHGGHGSNRSGDRSRQPA